MLNHLAAWLLVPALLQAQLPSFSNNSQPNPNQKLALYAKPSLVRVVAGCYGEYMDTRDGRWGIRYPIAAYSDGSGSYSEGYVVGSGFFISPDGYIVTSANVVKHAKDEKTCRDIVRENVERILQKSPHNESPSEAKRLIESGEIGFIEGSLLLYQDIILPHISGNDQIEIRTFQVKEIDESKDVAIIKIAIRNTPALILANDDTLQHQAKTLVIGYPEADDLIFYYDRSISTQSLGEATITEGSIANPNMILKDGSPIIQVDVRVGDGSAGSPVLNDQGEVIGMIKHQDEGGSIPLAIPTSTIQELVRKSGAENRVGRTDAMYREGLALFWQGDFEGAKTKFQAVTSLFPQHSEANRLIRESDQKIADELGAKNYLLWLVVTGIGVAGLGAAYLIVRRKSATPAFAGEPPIDNSVEPDSVLDEPNYSHRREVLPRFITNIFRPPTMVSTQAFIELQNQQGQVRRLYLQKERHQLGREQEWSDIEIPDENWEVISRRQAVIEQVKGGYQIYDGDRQRTTNGIFINGKPINAHEGYLLQDQDKLEIGQDTHNKVVLTYFNPISSQPIASHSRMEE